MTRHHLRNEMDSISEEYCVDRADIGSAQSEPVVSVAAASGHQTIITCQHKPG